MPVTGTYLPTTVRFVNPTPGASNTVLGEIQVTGLKQLADAYEKASTAALQPAVLIVELGMQFTPNSSQQLQDTFHAFMSD